MSIDIPVGTKIYLKRRCQDTICITPGDMFQNDVMYVSRDVKVNCHVVIPQGTRIMGDWITEEDPLAVQFQASYIFLRSPGQEISGDSCVFEPAVKRTASRPRTVASRTSITRKRPNLYTTIVIGKKEGETCKCLTGNCDEKCYVVDFCEVAITLSSKFVSNPFIGKPPINMPSEYCPSPCPTICPTPCCVPCVPCMPCCTRPPIQCQPKINCNPIVAENAGKFTQTNFGDRGTRYKRPDASVCCQTVCCVTPPIQFNRC